MKAPNLLQLAEFLCLYPIVFIKNVPTRLKCVICKQVLKNSKQTSCGCKVCEKCILNYLKDGEQPCPSKQQDCADTRLKLDRDIFQDNATNKEIAQLEVECPFKMCSTIGTIRNIIEHIEECTFRDVTCEKCQKKYCFKDKGDHDKFKCDYRTVECKFCGINVTANILRTVHNNIDHDDLCSKFRGNCPNECNSNDVLLKDHLKKCNKQRVYCPLFTLGCTTGKMTQSKLIAHLRESIVEHSLILVSEAASLESSTTSFTIKTKQLEVLINEQVTITGKCSESCKKIERSIGEVKTKGFSATSMATKPIVNRNGSYIWKITDFSVLKAESESSGRPSITSDSFYTSEFGYRMCLRIYPAGDGIGRNTHLSVFFAIMRGDFDDLLSWPFKQKVTLSLLDQENACSKNHLDTFKPDARSACYQKPVDDCNIASGSPKFIPFDSLFPSSVYWKNDTLYLKISVDTVGMLKP